MVSNYGIVGEQAPEWYIKSWIDKDGNPTAVSLKDLRGRIVFVLCFQSWCPGCHSSGFPTLQKIQELFKDSNEVKLLAIQTVFESFESNTEDKVRKEQIKYNLQMPMGHDPGEDRSTIMRDYHTGGTPWIIIIDKKGIVRYNDFHIDSSEAIEILRNLS